jgi:NitT/TauT family transport system substrate-binding protein
MNVASIGRLAAAAACVVLALGGGAAAQTKVVFGDAAGASLADAPIFAARQLGYFESEGVALDIRAFPGGANTVAQTVNGTAMVSWPGNEPVIIGKQPGRDNLPLRFFYNALPTVIWELVVKEDSPIHALADLKGKKIGIFAPSASNVPQVKAILRHEGLNPDTDVTMRSIGLGAGALNALNSGTVDVVALYDTEHAAFETAGTRIRRLPVSPVVARLFSNGLLTREENLQDPDKRALLVKVGRGMAKGTLFCETNPRTCVVLAWRDHPELKPTGVDDETAMTQTLWILQARLKNLKLRDYQDGMYGRYDPAAWQAYVDFMLNEKVLDQPVDVNTLFTNDLIPEINRFDHAAVIAQAKAM